jgi:hypothetical protein
MTKELFALYLVFSTPNGVEERFVMERENCKNLQPIVEQEFKRLNINRDGIQSGHICIGWKFHLIRQRALESQHNSLTTPPQPRTSRPCVVPMRESE